MWGCTWCSNWHGVGTKVPNPKKGTEDKYRIDPINAINNNGLKQMVEKLQLIYKSIDKSFVEPRLSVSLYESGKSSADFLELAGHVALGHANCAFDLEFTAT